MTFRTPFGHSTTELQETRGSLCHIHVTRFVTNILWIESIRADFKFILFINSIQATGEF